MVLIFQPEEQINIKRGCVTVLAFKPLPEARGGEATFGLPHLGCLKMLFTFQSGHLKEELMWLSVSCTANNLWQVPLPCPRQQFDSQLMSCSKFVLLRNNHSHNAHHLSLNWKSKPRTYFDNIKIVVNCVTRMRGMIELVWKQQRISVFVQFLHHWLKWSGLWTCELGHRCLLGQT